ncbi:siphovirus Gp157 family protein [Francisella marina]|uniref:Siphovirus Gp157 family protein n=1 Tax=Francisella marina TaxID=2249302 RepID=A0ABX5ZGR5_9GAMM|nr:siphovirus Gp157 family protein [Francisella marina]QEO57594.1 hypothetical protein F0R74_06905 [Francisella marina]QEO58291.1 hypothetical protein F0R75_00335 [Francisella marina]
MSNLYQISHELEQAINNILDLDDMVANTETGEVISKEQYNELLDKLQMDKQEKIKNILLYIKSLEADSLAIQQEIKRLQNLKKTKDNLVERLKDYVLENVSQGDKFDFGIIKLSVPAGIEKVVIDDDAQIPKDLGKIEFVPNKTLIKKALKAGQDILGARLVNDDKRLLIK